MNIENYSNRELLDELARAKADKAHYEKQDKRRQDVRQSLLWANAIIKRDEAEIAYRGLYA